MKALKTLIYMAILLNIPAVKAASYLEDMQNLGYVSGEGLACNAEKYPTYEFIARAYLISRAKSDNEQAEGMYAYNKAKARSYMNKRSDGLLGCNEISSRFNRQKLLKSTIYKDGTIKLPDGKVVKPRQKYDVTLVYNRNDDERAKLNAYYDKVLNKKKQRAAKEGIFNKIKQEEQKSVH